MRFAFIVAVANAVLAASLYVLAPKMRSSPSTPIVYPIHSSLFLSKFGSVVSLLASISLVHFGFQLIFIYAELLASLSTYQDSLFSTRSFALFLL